MNLPLRDRKTGQSHVYYPSANFISFPLGEVPDGFGGNEKIRFGVEADFGAVLESSEAQRGSFFLLDGMQFDFLNFVPVELANRAGIFLYDRARWEPACIAVEARELITVPHATEKFTVAIATKILAADFCNFFHLTPHLAT